MQPIPQKEGSQLPELKQSAPEQPEQQQQQEVKQPEQELAPVVQQAPPQGASPPSPGLPAEGDELWQRGIKPTGCVLGSGVAGTVLLANRGDEEQFAVKIFRSHKQQDAEHEAKMLRTVSNCRNIVTLHDVLYSLEWTALVLELCSMGSLHDLLCSLHDGQLLVLDALQTQAIVYGMLNGLAAIHASGIIHLVSAPLNAALSLLLTRCTLCRISRKTTA